MKDQIKPASDAVKALSDFRRAVMNALSHEDRAALARKAGVSKMTTHRIAHDQDRGAMSDWWPVAYALGMTISFTPPPTANLPAETTTAVTHPKRHRSHAAKQRRKLTTAKKRNRTATADRLKRPTLKDQRRIARLVEHFKTAEKSPTR
jgi:hypothetical protein